MNSELTWRQVPEADWKGPGLPARSDDGGPCPPEARRLVARVVLYRGDVCRLPRSAGSVAVCAGQAWITHAGQDLVIGRGETARLEDVQDTAVASALGSAPLVLAVYAKG